MSMWSTASGDYGTTSMEADPQPGDEATHCWFPWVHKCSDPPEESCSDAGCPVHGDGEGG